MQLAKSWMIGFFSVLIVSNGFAQNNNFDAINRPKDLSDTMLLDLVQRQTFKYFWDFAHPISGLARERSNAAYGYGHEVVTIGGSGFGVMALIVATERKWIGRDTAAKFLLKMLTFLSKADSYHGVYPHWLNGTTGKTIPFSKKDDGADVVETSFLLQGLLCAKQYFNYPKNKTERQIRLIIQRIWDRVDWNWFTQGGKEVLYWHYSNKYNWGMNHPIKGYNECLITYILAAANKNFTTAKTVYNKGWAKSNFFYNGKIFYGYKLPLGFDYGGPLFFTHYSFLGLDPRGLKDQYADYWLHNRNHSLINYEYCVDNSKGFKGYSDSCWGLSAGDTYDGYNAHSPTNDFGTITISAALSSFPYTPEESMKALKYFYYQKGDQLWSQYGFVDGFNETKNWYATTHIAIDQGPIIVMIENYRTGLLWKLFMANPEVQYGLQRLNFTSPYLKNKKSVIHKKKFVE